MLGGVDRRDGCRRLRSHDRVECLDAPRAGYRQEADHLHPCRSVDPLEATVLQEYVERAILGSLLDRLFVNLLSGSIRPSLSPARCMISIAFGQIKAPQDISDDRRGDRYPRIGIPVRRLPLRRFNREPGAGVDADLPVGIHRERGWIPELAEAHGELTEEFAVMNSNERALELGFSGRQAMDLSAVLEGHDDLGELEVRQVYFEHVDVNGTHVLFEEANDLAGAVANLLELWDRFRGEQPSGEEPAHVEGVRLALATYDRRWEVDRAATER